MKLGTTPNVVFSTLVDDYAWPPTLLKRLSKHFKGAGVSNVGFHGFRHTHASLMANCGIEPKILQHRMGHSTLAMTMDIYSHLSEDNAKKPFHTLKLQSIIYKSERGIQLGSTLFLYPKIKKYYERVVKGVVKRKKHFGEVAPKCLVYSFLLLLPINMDYFLRL